MANDKHAFKAQNGLVKDFAPLVAGPQIGQRIFGRELASVDQLLLGIGNRLHRQQKRPFLFCESCNNKGWLVLLLMTENTPRSSLSFHYPL